MLLQLLGSWKYFKPREQDDAQAVSISPPIDTTVPFPYCYIRFVSSGLLNIINILIMSFDIDTFTSALNNLFVEL